MNGTYGRIKDCFISEPRGGMMVKGKEEMKVWHVVSVKESAVPYSGSPLEWEWGLTE